MIPTLEPGKDWKVERDCCLSGNCNVCYHVTALGIPVKIVQIDRINEGMAKSIANKWKSYRAVAVKMD